MKINKLVLAGAVSMALAACGGSGGNSSTADNAQPGVQAPATASFTGTAAVGAPLVGTVTVKDSKGATKTVTIGANGAYTVDVTGMTGPFVFRATGAANGRIYTVHSVATSADAAGKINITQLTDLVAANVGGQLAQDYFDQFEKNSNAATATSAAINAEVAKLKEKLQPILSALGVDANADLLRTPFTPLASALDSALDAIHVSVDSSTAVATISTTANASVITDDLKQKAAAETNPSKLAADNISTATTDAPLIKKALTDFIGRFANGMPTAAALTSIASTGFLNDGMNAESFFSYLVTETSLAGASFTDVEVLKVDYSDPGKIIANVSFTVKSKDGLVLDRLQNWKVRKSPTDGVWRLFGNQRTLEVNLFAEMSKVVSASGTCFRSGLNIDIQDRDVTNKTTSGVIDHLVVKGPGLPESGLSYKSNGSGGWQNTLSQGNSYVMRSDCPGPVSPLGDDGVTRIPDNSAYVLTAFDSANNKLSFASGTNDGTYALKVQRRPMTLAEAKASTGFPVFSEQTIAAFASYNGGTLAIAGSNLNPTDAAWVKLVTETSLSSGKHDTGISVMPSASGAFSTSLQLQPLQQGETMKSRNLWVDSTDIYRRNLQTLYLR
ncbi:hypothetical protein [Pseudoduganella violaceinigra]|uniref:hypothetical protein n=1 Tax=Pseudoduganella violaceinigra TaxID=246602 RepID=UPI000403466E|nr:hypothetical protein [Pseudoduganella violaceinigra]